MHSALPSARSRRVLLASLAAVVLCAGLAGCGGGGGSAGSGPTIAPAPGVDGPAWRGYAGNSQHTALGQIATQDLNRIAWSTPVDLAPVLGNGALLIHYGSPAITSHNTVVVPVKTGRTGGFRVEARSGTNGGLIWSADSDYVLPPSNWVPSYNVALSTSNRLFAPAVGGKLLVKDDADASGGALRTLIFYGANAYNAAPATFDATVFVNTPITVDTQGNAFFGFYVGGANPLGLVSGIARIAADGTGLWLGASAASADPTVDKVAMNSAPALSPDEATLYIAVNAKAVRGAVQGGYLLALDSRTLAVTARALLTDPSTGTPAQISDDGTASPTVGPDGDVYFGVLEASFGTHNGRGWLLHFSAALAAKASPGGFGWDDTASVVPSTLVPSYTGRSSYLLMIKYNNYAGIGTGDGANRLAIVDPGASQVDPISGLPIMKEVLTVLGPTFEAGTSGPVREWCINTAAVDPFTRSVLVNSEDGVLYRWNLATNTLSQRIRLTAGLGEAYTPTAIGADGAVYAIQDSVLFSIAK